MTKSLLLLALLIIGHLPLWSRGRFNNNDEYDRITIFKIVLMTVILVLLAGCAARQPAAMPWAEPAGQPTQPVLSETIREPLSPRITDTAVQARLAGMESTAHPDPVRLEILILQALAEAPNDAAVSLILDRLWAEEPLIRQMASGAAAMPEGPGQMRVAALLHHLLMAAPAASWQAAAAGKIHSRHLTRAPLRDLRGYPLHFHCWTLLRGGRFAEAVASLRALESIVPADIQVANLTLALETALAGQAVEPVSPSPLEQEVIPVLEILADLCRIGAATGARLPEELMVRAAMALQARGHGLALRRSLGPWLSAGSRLSLNRLQAQVFSDHRPAQPHLVHVPASITPTMPSSAPRPSRKLIHVQIEHIRAGHDARGRAAVVNDSVRRNFSFTSYTLLSSQSLALLPGQSAEHAMGQGRLVRVTALDAIGPKARFDVRVTEHGRQVLHTVVQSPDGGEAYIGGPCSGTEQDLIRLKVRFGSVSENQVKAKVWELAMDCPWWRKSIAKSNGLV